jgi:hypothetical protein
VWSDGCELLQARDRYRGVSAASRTITTLTDDIDGGEAAETVTLAFKGAEYEIDVSKKNLDKMVKALQPYTAVARKGSSRRSGSGRATRSGADREQLAQIREWVRVKGHQVSYRGRISAAVREAYHAPTNPWQAPKAPLEKAPR